MPRPWVKFLSRLNSSRHYFKLQLFCWSPLRGNLSCMLNDYCKIRIPQQLSVLNLESFTIDCPKFQTTPQDRKWPFMSVFTLKSHNFSAQLVNSLKIFSIDALQKYVIKNWQALFVKAAIMGLLSPLLWSRVFLLQGWYLHAVLYGTLRPEEPGDDR